MKTILIKLSGELFSYKKKPEESSLSIETTEIIKSMTQQIKMMTEKYRIGLVVGGGNFFRGKISGEKLGLKKTSSHNIGMLSTIVNGIIMKDFFSQGKLPSTLLSASSNNA